MTDVYFPSYAEALVAAAAGAVALSLVPDADPLAADLVPSAEEGEDGGWMAVISDPEYGGCGYVHPDGSLDWIG